ncbi:hypothetical protein BKA82DRAFT_30929 [Pisolithus tinctorius]|uniref:Uncharacterized protein n=1 Tax=Pisolithus tinctorius Marx 270 TaxID=870435 RepID=A0A0C3NCY0_PISTI|nr:hypothetical protein BKA82DRAFT_30929 [Pisolithus tinctorius]KIN98964.1 hypothetical protein M404DRAFT_30929 [Pisolithus tinctorius Marx 270]
MTSSNTDIPLGAIRSAGKGKDDFANCASGELETIVVEGMTKVYLVNGETNSSQTDLETLEGAFDVVVKGTDATTQKASPITAGWMQVAVRELSGHLDSATKGPVRLLQSALKYGRIVSAFFVFTEKDRDVRALEIFNEQGNKTPVLATYHASEVLAEQNDWRFAKDTSTKSARI